VVCPVKIPCSGKRGGAHFSKVLYRVRSNASSGFDFEGHFVRTGSTVEFASLRPTIDYPENPVLLECAGVTKPVRMNRPTEGQRSEVLYILWRFDPGSGEFLEIARAQSSSRDWAVDLAAPARRALEAGIEPPNLAEVQKRIRSYLALELERVSREDRARVAGVLHDDLAALLDQGGVRWEGDTSSSLLLL
jgi:hypothetical protein